MLGGIDDIDYGNHGTKIMLKRRIKKTSRTEVMKTTGRQYLVCKECNNEEVLVSTDIGAVTCGRCVQRMSAPPQSVQKKPEGEKFPRGWHFKARYVHTDGKVYVRGQLTTETDAPPTKNIKKKVAKKITKTKTKKHV
jgi:ribosomal protein S27E